LKPRNCQIRKTIVETIGRAVSLSKFDQFASIPLYRNALYLIGSSVVTTSMGFFFWMTVARFYSTTELGFGSAIISAVNIIAIFSVIGLNFSIIRFLPGADKPREMINSCLTLSGLVSLFAAVIFLVGTDFWSPALSFVKDNAIFFLIFVAMAVLSTLSTLVGSVYIARRRAVFVLFTETTGSLLKIPLVVGFAAFLHTSGVIASLSMAIGIALVISVLFYLPRVENGYRPVPSFNLSQVRVVWKYATNSYLASLLTRGPILILPLMVVNMLGTDNNAYFYVAWTVANVLAAVTRSISQSLFAESVNSSKDIKKNVARSVLFTCLLLIPAIVVLIAVGKWILLAFGPSYSDNALRLLWLLAISSLPRGIIHIYSGLLRAQDRLKELLIIRSLMAVAVLISSWFVIPVYGIIGIGYIWLAIHTLAVIAITPRIVSQAGRFSRINQAGRFSRINGGDWEDVDHF